jgi:hypothetical protein
MRSNKCLSLVIIAIFFNIAIISTANAQQCRTHVYVSGWDSYSDYYTACHPWLKATMEFDAGENNGMGQFLAYVNNCYEREFDIWDYPEDGHYAEVEYRYCTTLTEHEASIELHVGPPVGEEETWRGFTNPELNVSYYASKPD